MPKNEAGQFVVDAVVHGEKLIRQVMDEIVRVSFDDRYPSAEGKIKMVLMLNDIRELIDSYVYKLMVAGGKTWPEIIPQLQQIMDEGTADSAARLVRVQMLNSDSPNPN